MNRAINFKTYVIKSKQNGAVLAITIIFLLLLTILGMAAIENSIIQSKIENNLTDADRAFQAAESALREGESFLFGLSAKPIIVNTCQIKPCVLIHNSTLYPENQNLSWWETNGTIYQGSLPVKVAARPLYIIQFQRFIPDDNTIGLGQGTSSGKYYYQITARGTGSNINSISILQSVVVRRF